MKIFNYINNFRTDAEVRSFRDSHIVLDKNNNHATYVIVHNPEGEFCTTDLERVDIVSINGIGEVRWKLAQWEIREDNEWIVDAFNLLLIV